MDTAAGGTSGDLYMRMILCLKTRPRERKFDSTHEGGVRVPFFVYWKDKIKAGENDHICTLYDVLAAAADLAVSFHRKQTASVLHRHCSQAKRAADT